MKKQQTNKQTKKLEIHLLLTDHSDQPVTYQHFEPVLIYLPLYQKYPTLQGKSQSTTLLLLLEHKVCRKNCSDVQ